MKTLYFHFFKITRDVSSPVVGVECSPADLPRSAASASLRTRRVCNCRLHPYKSKYYVNAVPLLGEIDIATSRSRRWRCTSAANFLMVIGDVRTLDGRCRRLWARAYPRTLDAHSSRIGVAPEKMINSVSLKIVCTMNIRYHPCFERLSWYSR